MQPIQQSVMQVHWWNSASFKWAFVAKHVSFAFNVYLDGIECCIISSNLKLPAGTFQTNHVLPHLFFHLICWENSHIFFLTNVKHAVFVLGKGIRERDGPAGLCHLWSGTRCSKHGPEKHSWRRRPERKSSQVGTVWVLSQTLLSNAEKKTEQQVKETRRHYFNWLEWSDVPRWYPACFSHSLMEWNCLAFILSSNSSPLHDLKSVLAYTQTCTDAIILFPPGWGSQV